MTERRLWTWQHPDRDLISQKWSGAFGEKAWTPLLWPRLTELYEMLRDKLSMEEFVWCYLRDTSWQQGDVRTLWVLEVPLSEVHYLWDHVWWDVLVKKNYEQLSEAEAWESLFLKNPTGRDVTALIRSPIPATWVIDKTRLST